MKLKKKFNQSSLLPCFYCGADSDEIKYFLITFIGGLVLFTIFSLIGLWLRGTFRNTESLNDRPIKAENEE